jgi:hypothetical protein
MFDVLAQTLVLNGFTIDEHDDGMLLAHNPKLRVRALAEFWSVEFGHEETFDRWANSSDFRVALPPSSDQIEELLKTVSLQEKCCYCDMWDTPHIVARKRYCQEHYDKIMRRKDSSGKRKHAKSR